GRPCLSAPLGARHPPARAAQRPARPDAAAPVPGRPRRLVPPLGPPPGGGEPGAGLPGQPGPPLLTREQRGAHRGQLPGGTLLPPPPAPALVGLWPALSERLPSPDLRGGPATGPADLRRGGRGEPPGAAVRPAAEGVSGSPLAAPGPG